MDFTILEQWRGADPVLVHGLIFGIGAIIGSFLSVVAARLPAMIDAQAEREARDILGVAPVAQTARFNLLHPRSHCPSCDHMLRWYENIPLVSFLVQRGRCRACGTAIGLRYPLTELAAGVLCVGAALVFGATLQGACLAVLLLGLLTIALIDLDHQLIPDAISQPLLWLGLGLNAVGTFTSPFNAMLGAIMGYGILWLIATSYRLATGKDAMGQGDMKLAAVLGAWGGATILPGLFVVAFLLGACVGLAMVLARRARSGSAVPFGPFLAFGAMAVLAFPGPADQLARLFLP